jgi:hypothetical protein
MFITFLIIWELPVLIRGAVELMPSWLSDSSCVEFS